MDRADHRGVGLRQLEERAVPQVDPAAVARVLLGGEPEVVEE